MNPDKRSLESKSLPNNCVVKHIYSELIGKIKYMRNDKWEIDNALTGHYFVEYEDGTFDTYVSYDDLEIVK